MICLYLIFFSWFRPIPLVPRFALKLVPFSLSYSSNFSYKKGDANTNAKCDRIHIRRMSSGFKQTICKFHDDHCRRFPINGWTVDTPFRRKFQAFETSGAHGHGDHHYKTRGGSVTYYLNCEEKIKTYRGTEAVGTEFETPSHVESWNRK